MTGETQLWIGLFAGAIIGTCGTWITIWCAILIGRHFARRQPPPVAAGHWEPEPEPEPATGEIWPTIDTDVRRLIEREGGR